MKSISIFAKMLPVIAIMSSASLNSSAQIYTYTSDSVGVYNAVATNATGANLGRIHGAGIPNPSCHNGFSSKTFTTATTFATTMPADTMSVGANTGYLLHITGFSVDIRRSPTGPASVRYAYSLDSGTTWVNQGTDQAPNNQGCDSMVTATWTTTVTVTAPHRIEFAVFGFNASSTSGTFQIKNLIINGSVLPTSSTGLMEINPTDNGMTIYPNPTDQKVNVAYHLDENGPVTIGIYNILGQQVAIADFASQTAGDQVFTTDIAIPGLYTVRLNAGGKITTGKLIKQ